MAEPYSTPPDSPPLIGLDYAGARTARNRVPWWVWALIVVAVAGRIAFAFTRPVDQAALAVLPDQLEYIGIAESIRDGGSVEFHDRFFRDFLYSYRMPAYPAMIAALRCDLRIVQCVQAMLEGSAMLAVFLVGRQLRGVVVGGLAALAVAGHPFLVYFSSLFLTETVFTAILAWGVYALLQRRPVWRAAGVLLLLGAVYVRPSAAGLGVLAAGVTFFDFGNRRRWLHASVAVVTAVIGLFVILLPWAVRNHSVNHRFIWLTTNDGFTAYDSFNPKADGSSNQGWFRDDLGKQIDDLIERQELELFGEARTPKGPRPAPVPSPGAIIDHRPRVIPYHGEVERSDQLAAMAWDYARSHPGRVITLAFAKIGRFWSPVPLSADFGGRWLYWIVGGLYTVPLFLFAIIGVFRGGLGRRATLILLLPALYFSAVHCVFVGSLRYRVPCDVPLAVLAAAGVTSFIKPKTGDA